ncbi:hypothetical protein FIM08_03475 [SAR202 cluster bacterium AC-647-N09_OGT_505m]|nr:hypothetical protein [SAR202 cluster bacterium AC-647-N09_OGT_505m]
MKPVWSSKEEKCDWCNETIPKGERRLDDSLSLAELLESGYSRLHYHPPCWTEKTEKWWAENPITSVAPRAVKPPLALGEWQRLKRKHLLSRLSQMHTHYTKTDPIDLDKVEEGNIPETYRAKVFEIRVTHVLRSLESVGGIPQKYSKFLDE